MAPSPYVTTPADVVACMLDAAHLRPGDRVCDLGCGDGRLVIEAALRLGCRGWGIDHDPARIEQARRNAARAGVENLVRFEVGDLFQQDLSEVDVLLIYLLPNENVKLLGQLARLPAGARIVSHDFEIPGWPARHVFEFTSREDGYTRQIHVWQPPLPFSAIGATG